MSRFCRVLAALAAVLTAPAMPTRADVNGFGSFAPVNTQGQATVTGYSTDKSTLTVTDGGPREATSGFARAPQRVTSFAAAFTYQTTNFGGDAPGGADGIAFVIQDDPRGLSALGAEGNALGYGGATAVTRSFAVQLRIFQASGESIAVDGGTPSYSDTLPVDFRGGHPIRVTLTYDGDTLTETFTDQMTGETFTTDRAADIPATLGSKMGLVGFSGASGAATAKQTVSDFTFAERPDVPPAQRKHLHPVIKSYRTLTDYVDPFIGTDGGGNAYPGAVAPFGMAQFSPDTNAPSIGYGYGDRQIQGFSLTHMSGVGCNDYGDVFLTATSGPVKTDVADYESPYSHRQETASPGYYQVKLLRWNVNAELTATTHAGLIRFTFPVGHPGNILLPISHTLTRSTASQIKIVSNNEIEGQVTSQSFCGAGQYYTVYFVAQFDQPFQASGTFTNSVLTDGGKSAAQTDDHTQIGAYVSYPAIGPRTIQARIGISFVDMAGARANLLHEISAWDFAKAQRQATDAWERELHVIDVSGGTTSQKVKFYTALYHTLLMPNIFSDVDGRYIGFDNKIHQTEPGRMVYANYSGWDIYRDEVPLLALIESGRLQDMCQSAVLMYKQGGWIDRWPQANTYTNVMCGSPLTTVMATAWNAGLQDFDIALAYQGMYKDATQPPPGGKPYAGESNVPWMDKVGYIPDDKEGYGSVSQTEEDCYAYAALASVADSLGIKNDAAYLRKRALFYRNLFDPDTKFMRPKLADGSWYAPFDPAQEHGYVEGSGWHYAWLAPQDVAGLIQLMGGDDAFNAKLDQFFSYPHPVWDDHYYNPYNEPDLQAPFLYDYSGAPWKTQARVRELLADAYGTTPTGIPGNDDCGTMSAWYVLASMGIYAVDPARPAFELTSPLFPQITVHLSKPYSGKQFVIKAPAASEDDPYIQSATLNGSAWPRPWVPQSALTKGGTLTFMLGPQPNKGWGADVASRPPSLSQ